MLVYGGRFITVLYLCLCIVGGFYFVFLYDLFNVFKYFYILF